MKSTIDRIYHFFSWHLYAHHFNFTPQIIKTIVLHNNVLDVKYTEIDFVTVTVPIYLLSSSAK